MASVKKNPNGTWRVRACLGRDERTGKQIWRTTTFQGLSETTPKKEEKAIRRMADDWEAQQKADYEMGLDAHRDKMTLEKFTREKWRPNIEARTVYNTRESYRRISERILEYFGARIRLAEINVERVDGFIRWLKAERKLADKTVRKYFDVLRSILSYAVETGYLSVSPIEKMKNKPQARTKEPDYLSMDEARQFLEALENDRYFDELWKAYFSLLLFGGVRRGEGLAVQWKDYDPDKKELFISKSVTLADGSERIAIKAPKNGKSRRVPVSDSLANALEARRREMTERYGECRDDWYIFGKTQAPDKPRDPNSVYQRLSRFQTRHGLRRTSVHMLRHSFASLALENGANLKAIQNTLGHSRPSMTLQFYSGVSERANRQAVDALEKAVRDGTKTD